MSPPTQEETRSTRGRVDRVSEQVVATTTTPDSTPLYVDLPTVVRLRREARERRALQQRADGRAAWLRTPQRTGRDETRIAREADVLYQTLTALEDAGRVKWYNGEGTWVEKRPPILITSRTNDLSIYSTDQILGSFERVRKTSKGWSARCPAHEDKSPSLTIAEGTKGWVFRCWAGCDFTDILNAAQLDIRQMFR